MKKLRLTRLLAVILAVIMVLPLFAACNKNSCLLYTSDAADE